MKYIVDREILMPHMYLASLMLYISWIYVPLDGTNVAKVADMEISIKLITPECTFSNAYTIHLLLADKLVEVADEEILIPLICCISWTYF